MFVCAGEFVPSIHSENQQHWLKNGKLFFFNQPHLLFALDFLKSNKFHQDL